MNQKNPVEYNFLNEVYFMNQKVQETFANMHSKLTLLQNIKSSLSKSVSLLSLLLMALSWPSLTNATIYINNTFETERCGNIIYDRVVEGNMWDNWGPDPAATVKCILTPPNGSNYVEWNPQLPVHDAGIEIYFPSTTLVPGKTYYFAAFWRFQRINGNDIWHDYPTNNDPPYSFDKLMEFRGSGFRWGIATGYNGYTAGWADHKFSIDAWFASENYQGMPSQYYEHNYANISPYGINNPPLLDYETWYSFVLGVTAQSNNNGRIQLWLNGVQVLDKPHYTMDPGGTIDHVIINGTIAQPAYDAPAHYRQLDALMLTDSWNDIVNGGYLRSPASQSGSTTPSENMASSGNTVAIPPSAPTNLRIIAQSQ